MHTPLGDFLSDKGGPAHCELLYSNKAPVTYPTFPVWTWGLAPSVLLQLGGHFVTTEPRVKCIASNAVVLFLRMYSIQSPDLGFACHVPGITGGRRALPGFPDPLLAPPHPPGPAPSPAPPPTKRGYSPGPAPNAPPPPSSRPPNAVHCACAGVSRLWGPAAAALLFPGRSRSQTPSPNRAGAPVGTGSETASEPGRTGAGSGSAAGQGLGPACPMARAPSPPPLPRAAA